MCLELQRCIQCGTQQCSGRLACSVHRLQRATHFGFRLNLMLPELASAVANLLPQLPNVSFFCFFFCDQDGDVMPGLMYAPHPL